MYQYFLNLWTDEKRFLGLLRGVGLALSGALLTDQLDLTGIVGDTGQNVLAFIGLFLAGFMRSSTTEPPVAPRLAILNNNREK